jgi:rubredoxin
MEEFLVDANGDDLPPEHYRCPVCGWAFHRKATPAREYTFQGQRRWMPPQIKIQRTPAPWEGYGPLGRVMER